jgi:DNA polymerase I-like protein with 3'-5' exonuclease and polymerase domains
MGADTTRITSGGKDKSNKTEYVNLLNLPSDEETRACFVAEKGNKWISIDYSGQETYLMASIANDEAIIKELTEGSGDIHSLTAYMSYPEIPRDTPIKEIKKKYHNLRQEAKGIEFAINYGGDANTIHQNKGIPIEEAQKIYDNYMNGFSGLKAYQNFRRKDWFDKGYILLNPLTGHKAFVYDYQELLADKKRMSEDGFWDYYREMKQDAPSCDTVQMVKHFFKRKSASEKQSINYPIQATGSMCLRYSMIYLWKYIISHNLQGKVKICVSPYDEINCEAPEEIAEDIAKVIYNCMVKAGSIFCTKCKLDADISRNSDGTLPNHWIH